MPWWSQPVADEEPPVEHVHFPEVRRFGCWTCSCGEVYEPQDVRKLIQPKRRPLARGSRQISWMMAGRPVVSNKRVAMRHD